MSESPPSYACLSPFHLLALLVFIIGAGFPPRRLAADETALTFLVVVPPWPFFNQSPQPFLPARTGRQAMVQGITVEVDGKSVQ